MKVLLVDDHTMMRDGLRVVLERDGIEVVGEAANGHEAIATMTRLRPDVVVMDVSMPGLNGVDATRRLLTDHPGLKVVALSMNSDRRYVVAMFAAGAVGFLLKNSAAGELVHAIRTVARDRTYVSPEIASIVVDGCLDQSQSLHPTEDKRLTPREREVLQLIAEGKSSKGIAVVLAVAVPTVETYRRQLMDKLQLRTIAELTKYAIREGLTTVG